MLMVIVDLVQTEAHIAYIHTSINRVDRNAKQIACHFNGQIVLDDDF